VCIYFVYFAGLVQPALGARVGDVMTRTGGVPREVTRFTIECANDCTMYDRVASKVYYGQFYKLLTKAGITDFSVELRKTFSIYMTALYLHYPVPIANIPMVLQDSGVVVAAPDVQRSFARHRSEQWTSSSVIQPTQPSGKQ
jgi:hypothetical protein